MSDQLPQDIPAEQSALGAMLLSRRAIDDLADTLNPADFYRDNHELICRAIYALHNDGQPVDVITLAQALGADIARAGGHTYLHELVGNVPTASNATYYADSIRAHALRRRLVEAGTKIVQMAHGAHDADDTAADALTLLETAATTTEQATEHHAADLLDQALDAIDPATPQAVGGVPTGWPEVDDILLPLMPGQLVVIGGRPAIGKSVIGLDIARHTALRLGQPAVILSLEMSRDEVMQRLLASEARVSLTHLRMRTLDEGAWHRIAQASNRIREAPLWIDDSSHADLPHLRAIVRRRKPAVTVVDYAQLVHTEKAESRQQAVAALMRGFKLLAKRERTCVVALSQLNRGAAHRANAKPIITDLRETGESEQAADVVILLHREEGRPDVMQLEIAKQRNGPQGEALLAFQGHYSRAQSLMRAA